MRRIGNPVLPWIRDISLVPHISEEGGILVIPSKLCLTEKTLGSDFFILDMSSVHFSPINCQIALLVIFWSYIDI